MLRTVYIQCILGQLHQLQQELLCLGKPAVVSVKVAQHIDFVHFGQYLQESAQLLGANVLVFAVLDQLDNIVVRTETILCC